ncbi:hypothetical protein GGX14DRAFT_400314 [Mycena pura]|uniref:Glycosyl transferase family 28 C-terminal domain-containing protein n=1 Tax=Mycena pura TaxID=153505 RepID=A0AAD6Y614_9AGAR|nr:hypothetical protein GGX14DRAFT_400314 [Mycena pura]
MDAICDRLQALAAEGGSSSRVLMYSHDNFGLGHLRRCRAIAHTLVERFPNIRVLIVSGSAIGNAFDFRDRVEYLQIPSVVRLMNDDHAAIIKLMSGLYLSSHKITLKRQLCVHRVKQ